MRLENSLQKRRELGIGRAYQSFSSILREETSVIFLERFVQRLTNLLTKTYGETETKRIIDFLQKGKVIIGNPESFLLKYAPMNDNSIALYNLSGDLDEFFFNALTTFKKRAEDGETDIVLREFFLVLIDIFSKNKKLSHDKLIFYIRYIFLFLSNITHPAPFTLQLIHPKMLELIKEYIDLDLEDYNNLYILIFAHLKKLTQQNVLTKKEAYFPKMEIIYPVHKDARAAQQYYLASIFKMKPRYVNSYIKDIPNLSKRTSKLDVALNRMLQKTNYNKNAFDMESIYLELERIEKIMPLKTYPLESELYQNVPAFNTYKDIFKDKRIRKTYIFDENYQETFEPYSSNITIDCYRESRKKVEEYIDVAKNLSLVKNYTLKGFKEHNIKNRVIKCAHKITFINVTDATKEFTSFVEDKIEQINSITNTKFVYEIKFHHNSMDKFLRQKKSKYIRVISDIHADINRNKNYAFNFENDFVINCGDTAGDAITCREWNKTHIQKGVVVLGNHLGYSPSYPELNNPEHIEENLKNYGHPTHVKNTKNEQIYEVGVALTGKSGPLILSNSETEYEGIKILGTTLYTDFNLYGEKHKEEYMAYAQKYMNDFRYITLIGHREYKQNRDGTWEKLLKKRSNSQIRLFTPQDHAYYFNFSLGFLKQKVLEYKNKPIIIVTHHAPSPYCISPQYQGSMLNPAFASNLNQFILENPQIRLWCFGHCVDDKTEVLTTEGWKTFETIKQTDKLLNLNISTNKIEEDKINFIINKNYTGNVYYFHSKGTDLRVTDEHDMLTIYKKTKKITKIKAKDLYNKKQKFLIRAGLQDKKGLDLSDNLLRLLVWISADGNISNKTSNLVRVHLYKHRKIERLKQLLAELKIPYKEYLQKDGANNIHFYLPDELQGYSFKPIDARITSCNKHQCAVILEEYANTDGYKPYKSYVIYTSKKEEAEAIQLMCITNEYGCIINTRENHGFKLQSNSKKTNYELYIVNNPYRCLDNPQHTVSIEKVENEHFWCLNTNNGTLIVRRNGKVNITGNCHSSFDFILGETRLVCEPFGYGNENNKEILLPSDYGKRISIKNIKDKKSWREILKNQIEQGSIKCYDN